MGLATFLACASLAGSGREARRAMLRDALWESLAPMVRGRRFAEAVAAAAEFRKASPSQFAEAVTRGAARCVEAAADFWRAAAAGLQQATGKQLRLKGILWTISAFDGARVTLRSGGVERRLMLTELSACDVAPFAVWRGAAARPHFSLACALAFEADWEGSREEATQAGEEERELLAEMTESLRRAYAGLVVREVRAALEAKDEKEACRLVRILLDEYGDTPSARDNRQWAQRLLARGGKKPPARRHREGRGRVCPRCLGTGRITVARWRRHGMISEKVAVSRRCPVCGGRGRVGPAR